MFIEMDENKYYTIFTARETVLELAERSMENGVDIRTGVNLNMPWQQWKFIQHRYDSYTIVNRYSGKCIDLRNKKIGNGAKLNQWELDGSESQLWMIDQLPNGSVAIRSFFSKKSIDIIGSIIPSGNRLQIWDSCDTPNQSWYILEAPSQEHLLKELIREAFEKLPGIIESLSWEQKFLYLRQLGEIKSRYNDPEFKLAVIGNFSTGKSTFLNALIGQELLSVSDLPTTAIPTYMRWVKREKLKRFHIRQKPEEKQSPIIKLTMQNGKEFVLNEDGVRAFRKMTRITLPNDIGKRLDFVTTTSSLIGKIKRIDVFFAEREGFDNLCLIDTPGINPGDEESRGHILQTQAVLKEEADAAMVLYTAKDAMANDTRRFMEDNAVHLMNDAIVVLTKMDLVPENQKEKIIRNTTRLLRVQYHQDEPRVYDISAGEALEYICGRSNSCQSKYWAEQFEQTVRSILEQLGKKRSQIVSLRIASLIRGMISAISQVIQEEQDKLSVEKELLEQASIENLEKDFDKIYLEYESEIEVQCQMQAAQIANIVGMCVKGGCDKICDKIDRAMNRRELDDSIGTYYRSTMEGVNREIIKRMDEKMSSINSLNKTYAKKAEGCLKKYDYYLGKINSHQVNVNERRLLLPALSLPDNDHNFFSGLMDNGMLLGPSVLVLGILGAIWDVIRFAAQKEKAKNAVKSELDTYKGKLTQVCKRTITDIEIQNKNWAKNILSDYKEKYSVSFGEIESAYIQHKMTVQNRLELNKRNCEIMEHLEKRLSEMAG